MAQPVSAEGVAAAECDDGGDAAAATHEAAAGVDQDAAAKPAASDAVDPPAAAQDAPQSWADALMQPADAPASGDEDEAPAAPVADETIEVEAPKNDTKMVESQAPEGIPADGEEVTPKFAEEKPKKPSK